MLSEKKSENFTGYIPFIGHSQKDKIIVLKTDQWLPEARGRGKV